MSLCSLHPRPAQFPKSYYYYYYYYEICNQVARAAATNTIGSPSAPFSTKNGDNIYENSFKNSNSNHMNNNNATSNKSITNLVQRFYSSTATTTDAGTDLKHRVSELIPAQRLRVKEIRSSFGEQSLGECTVNMAMGGKIMINIWIK